MPSEVKTTTRGKPKKPRIQAWSPSRLSTWEQCAYKAKLLYIDKLKEPANRFMTYGKDVHTAAEKYVLGAGPAHDGFGDFIDDIDDLKELRASRKVKTFEVERQLALDPNLKVVDWFAPNAWVRSILDVVYQLKNGTVVVIDYKTGKVREKDLDQMDIYAWAVFNAYETEQVTTKLWYLKESVENERTYTTDDLPQLEADVAARSGPMLADEDFEPNPGPLCKWCHFSSQHGKNPICNAG